MESIWIFKIYLGMKKIIYKGTNRYDGKQPSKTHLENIGKTKFSKCALINGV